MARIAIVGLGYVGLPLAVALARHGPTTGYDRDPARIAELEAGRDRTGEVNPRGARREPAHADRGPAAARRQQYETGNQ